MKVIRRDENHIEIFPESEHEFKVFEKALGWTGKVKLGSIICELKGYGVKDD